MPGPCPLCPGPSPEAPSLPVLWRDDALRIVHADEPDYPGFLRVIWREHVREMTDLDADNRGRCMAVVWAAEQALRDVLQPVKINVASLGNQVPHLHWHVIPRFPDDSHFPDPIWANRRRVGVAHAVDRGQLQSRLEELLGG